MSNPTKAVVHPQGRYNQDARTLTYALILKTVGRIYGLDMGKDHHNPQCEQVGDTHKHRWSEQYRDKEAYVPTDVTGAVSDRWRSGSSFLPKRVSSMTGA